MDIAIARMAEIDNGDMVLVAELIEAVNQSGDMGDRHYHIFIDFFRCDFA